MKINRIKVVNGGQSGCEVFYDRTVLKEGVSTVIDGSEKWHLPIPGSVMKTLNKIKPYYLMLTGHWRSEWEEFVSKGEVDPKKVKKEGYTGLVSLLDATDLKIFDTNKGLQIGGTVRTLGDKSVWITTPRVKEEDEFIFYDQILDLFSEFFEGIQTYMKSKQLFNKEEARQLLMDFYKGKEEEIERVKEQEQELCEEELKARLEEKGYIVLDVKTEVQGLEAHTEDSGDMPAVEGEEEL